jgi:predicted  nucleic acid-binding Zn-ribbon protein
MLQKCGGTWEKAGLEVDEEDFYKWYPEIMKPQSPYVVREGDETKGKKRAAAKGKGKGKAKALSDEEEDDGSVVSGGGGEGAVGETGGAAYSPMTTGRERVLGGDGNKEQAEGSQSGGRGKGVGSTDAGSEGPLKVRIPARSQGLLPSKADSVIRALQAKVQRLERDLGKELDKAEDLHRLADEVQRLGDALKTEEERTGNLVEAKGKYKTMVIGLRDMEAAAQEKIRVLEAAVEEGEAGRLELQRKLEEAQAQVGMGLGEVRPEVQEYLREKVEYEEWRDTGVRRMELAQELTRAEEDRAALRLRVLALDNERKEYEKRERDQKENLEDMEEELRAAVEKGEAAQAHVLELVQSSAGKTISCLSVTASELLR